MDIPSTIQILLLILITEGIYGNNSPPSLRSGKRWHVMEEDPVGTPVTKLQATDDEDDHITFSLESQREGDDIHTYFIIDKNQRVKVAKPLTGKAGEKSTNYLLRVRLDDGKSPVVAVEVLLSVTKDGEVGAKSGGRGNAGGFPGRWGGFGGGGGNPFGVPPSSPGFYGGATPVNGGGPGNNFGFIPQTSKPAPPLLIINKKVWKVNADANVGYFVDDIRVIDTPGYGYNLTLVGSKGLLKVDSSGKVTVAASLINQVKNLTINVTVSNPFTEFADIVVLHVVHPEHPPPSPPPLPPTTTTPPTSTPKSKAGDKGNNSQDLRVVGSSSGINGGSSGIATEPPKEAPEADISLTIIPIVVVVGISPVALAVYCYWRRIQRRKAQAEAKESAVVYSEKGEEATATQIAPRRSSTTDTTQRRSNSKIGFAAFFHRRAQSNKYEDDLKAGRGNTKRKLSEISAPLRDIWEFPRHHLKFMGILGEGCFGQVWKCEAVGLQGKEPMLVAVKTVKESAGERERKDLLQELKVLKNLGHHINVVSLLGCSTEKDPIFIILEYMIGGKLQSFLRASRADASYGNLHGTSSSITPRDLTIFTYQIARGMEFLARNGIIHRDLAARNVLVGEDKVCKVADFGFARDVANNRIYERKSDGRLPIRWMAPESLFDNIFTTKADVWSFGVLLWEIVTLGSTPYPGLGASEVMKKVKEGYRLEKPDHCRREVYNIMYYCWDKDPNERPSFTELVHTLESLLLSEVEYIELDRFPDHTYYNVVTEKADELL